MTAELGELRLRRGQLRRLINGHLTTLADAVARYRHFIENARVQIRAKQRVANDLCDDACLHDARSPKQ